MLWLIGRSLRIAHRQAAHFARRRQVRFQQRRRHPQNFRDVVEPVALVVGRQQRRHVHLQPQQIADRVRVLGAIQPMQRRAPRLGMRRVRLIERGLKPGDQPVDLGLIRPRHALRRHHAAAQLAHHLLPRLGVLAGMVDVQLVEHQPGGLGSFVVAGDAILIYQCVLRRNLLGAQHRSGEQAGEDHSRTVVAQ